MERLRSAVKGKRELKNRLKLGVGLGMMLMEVSLLTPMKVEAFRFVSWGDTKSGTSRLAEISNQADVLNPVLTIYTGDLESDGYTDSGIAEWEGALNGGSSPGNGMSLITFPVRGNHDTHVPNTVGWQAHFIMEEIASQIGVANYTELSDNLTYSFDYENSHFVGIDVPGSATMISSSQTAWLDSDLSAAESRGLTHAFIFFHGPIYYVNEHSSGVPSDLITVLNKHPIVSATFHGHEHVMAYVHIDSSRISSVTHPFEELVTGAGGAGTYDCRSGRSDYCVGDAENIGAGFASVDVNGGDYTVNMYLQGQSSPSWSKAFSKAGVTPQPTATPGGPTPSATPRPTATRTPTPRPTATLSPTPFPGGNSYEAESGALYGAAAIASCSNCSGGQLVGYIGNTSGNYVRLNNISVPSTGDYPMQIYYLVDGTRTFYWDVNGVGGGSVTVSGTSWTTVLNVGVTVTLNAGGNNLRFYNNSAYAPDLDRIVVGSGNIKHAKSFLSGYGEGPSVLDLIVDGVVNLLDWLKFWATKA